MSDNTLATVCWRSDFPTTCVPSMTDSELLECLRLVVWSQDGMAVVATHGERNGKINNIKRFDRTQRDSFKYGGSREFEPQL